MTSGTESGQRNAVEIRAVSKRFGATTVLDRVSIDIRRGEFLSLLGPSGCGKTTLLRIIAGFEQATAGEVLIEGRDVSGVPAYARSTNMIFQHLALFPHMTVAQNIAFGLRMKKTAPDLVRRRVAEALGLVQLEGYESRLPDQLSGGQKQRVAMARALVNDPAVLRLDEPLGALDLQLRLQMQVELRRLHRTLGSTFIFVTHDQAEAMAMSDRIAVLNEGRIVQLGTPQEIYETPRARFVAQFVGHANLFSGTVASIDADRTCLVDLTPGQPGIRCIAPAGIAPRQEVTIALRYEKVAVEASPDGPAAPAGSFAGLVKDRTYMGGFLRFRVITDQGREVTADVPMTPGSRTIGEGASVVMTWGLEDATVLAE